MPGNCSVFRSWNNGDTLTASDLTTSFTTVGITNMTPQCLDDFSVDNTQMQSTVDPFPGDVESKATSTAGELERIRFQIKAILGTTHWYHDPAVNLASVMPTGVITSFGGTAAPSGWVLCDGAAISRTTFAALFAVIDTAYGVGDGSTTFNTPNLKGRVPVGLDAGQTEFDVRGETGGAKTHTLSTAEMPVHTHSVTPNPHTHTAAMGTTAGVVNFFQHAQNDAGANLSTAGTSLTIGNAGSGSAHNNLQPYQIVNYIIKT